MGAALAMDAAAVSVSCGIGCRSNRGRYSLLCAMMFALFQFVMPILGWSIGKVGNNFFDNFDHIIAFAILLFLGTKMLFDARSSEPVGTSTIYSVRELFLLAIATSIDALTSGITIPVSVGASGVADILITAVMIGWITFLISLSAFFLGSRFSFINVRYARIAGGLMLILISMKTLIEGGIC